MNTSDMARLWIHAFDYLNSDSPSAPLLISMFEERQTSAFDLALPSTKIWSKAGWYPQPEGRGSDATTAEAGIIFAPQGSYVLALFSTAPEDFESLAKVASALDALHAVQAQKAIISMSVSAD